MKILYFFYISTVFILSMIPLGDVYINQHDKINHLVAFFIFTILGFLAYRFKYFILLILGIFAGSIIEILQSFTKYRSAEFADLIADSIGILLGIFVAFLLNKTIFKTKRNFTVYNINFK